MSKGLTKPRDRIRALKSKLIDILGVALVGVGVSLWIWPIQTLRSQAGGVAQANAILVSLVFIFLATQLTTVGVAFYAYSLSQRRAREDDEEIESTLDRLEALLNEKRSGPGSTPTIRFDFDSLRRNSSRHRLSKIHLLAVIEGIAVLLLYGWLVAEFKSNQHLTEWVLSSLPWAIYFLNDYFLFLLIGLLTGILLSQLGALRTRRSSPSP